MSSELEVRDLQNSEFDLWSRFVAAEPAGSIYSLPDYLAVLCEVTQARFRVLGVFKGTELLGGMAVYESKSKVGWVASNRLLLYYHTPVIRQSTTQYPSERTSRYLAIADAIADNLDRQPYQRLVLHLRHPFTDLRPFIARNWRVKPNYSYVVSIADLPATYARIDRNLRRLIERAADKELQVTDDDDFDSFYRLHVATHQRKGAPLYLPEAGFRRYFELLKAKDLCHLYHVRTSEGKSIATQLVLTGPHPITHTVCAAADAEYLSLGSTPFLRWRVFESLSRLGYKGNDLTDAALNNVTRFKSQLGGDLVTNWVVTKPDSFRFRTLQRLALALHRGKRLLRRS